MSLTTVQQYQFLRQIVPDGTVDNDDKFAILGFGEPASFELTSAQKKQLLRLPVVDGSITTSDKFAFLGYMQPVNPGGNIVEQFNVDWFIDPTYTLVTPTIDGAMTIQVEGMSSQFVGTYLSPGPIQLDRDFTPDLLSISAVTRGTSVVSVERLFSMSESSAPAGISLTSVRTQFAFSSGNRQLSIVVNQRKSVIT